MLIMQVVSPGSALGNKQIPTVLEATVSLIGPFSSAEEHNILANVALVTPTRKIW